MERDDKVNRKFVGANVSSSVGMMPKKILAQSICNYTEYYAHGT